MKKSKEDAELLDFDRDVPTVADDVTALQRLRNLPKLNSRGYLEFLASAPASTESLRLRKGPTGDHPFTL